MKKLFCLLSFTTIITLSNITVAEEKSSITTFSKDQVKQIEKITHDYLINNPQILIEVSQKLHEKERVEQKEQITKIKNNIPKYKNQIFDTKASGRIVLGNPEGKIIVAEFTQHQCPHCKSASKIVEKLLKKYPEIKLVVIYWPFFGNDAIYTAKAVLAAEKQNKAKDLDQAFFSNKDAITKDRADEIIKSMRMLDNKKLYADLAASEKDYDAGLKANFKLAEKLGLIGTPALIFTNKDMTKFSLVPGQTPSFEEDLIKALNEVS